MFVSAIELNALILHMKSGKQVTCFLKEQPKVSFVENDLIINLFKALCDDLDDKENDNFSTVFNKNIDKYLRNILQEKDCELIKEFGLLPVHLDAIMQINYIDELVLRIRRKIEEYSKVSAVKCRMYRTLCLCGGLMIIIILI